MMEKQIFRVIRKLIKKSEFFLREKIFNEKIVLKKIEDAKESNKMNFAEGILI